MDYWRNLVGLDTLSPELVQWLEWNGLHQYRVNLASQGYTDLELLADLEESEVADLVSAAELRQGHAAKLRRALRQLRQVTPANLVESPPAAGPGSEAGGETSASASAAACGGQTQQAACSAKARACPPPQAPAEGTPAEGTSSSSPSATSAAAGAVAATPDLAADPSELGHGASCGAELGLGAEGAGLVALLTGSRAVLRGLSRRPELNGKTGTLNAWDEATRRWEFGLECEEGQKQKQRPSSISVRSENVQLLQPADADHFRCCITRELMEQPVITSDGHTYERSAVARWLEEHNTSPKTGRELPDKVLRPNHMARAQILAWRERAGLPPLPPWEPEPQETVQTREPQEGRVPTGGTPLTLQTPAGNVVLPLPFTLVQQVQGQGQALVGNDPPSLLQALRANEALHEEVRLAWREEVQGGGGGGGGGEGLQEPGVEELARAVSQEPRLMEVVMQFFQANPEVQPQFASVVLGTGAAGWPQGFAPNGGQETPLFRAAREGECGVVEQLLGHRRGESLRQELTGLGDSLLHVASWWGHSRLVSMLLAKEHPVHVPARNRSTPLHYAAFRGHPDVVTLLLKSRADTERKMLGGDTAVHQASWQGHVQVLKLLLESRAEVLAQKDDGDSPLALAVFRGNVAAARSLLAHMGGELTPQGLQLQNHHGHTPLYAAAATGSAEVINLLVEARAALNARTDTEETALHRAVQVGSSGAVAALLDAGAEADIPRLDDDHTALNLAVLDGRTGLVQLLAQHRASVMQPRRDGLTPIHLAVIREATAPRRPGEGSLVSALVEAAAHPDSRAPNQFTPLHFALSQLPQAQHRTAAVHALLEQRAEVELPIRGGDRPLHLAVSLKLRHEAALLLEHRALLGSARDDGCRPLHVAAQRGAATCVELLLRARADASQRNLRGFTAADVARQCGFERIERMLCRPSQENT